MLIYLVSGNEGGWAELGDGFISAQDAELGADAILLVGAGSAGPGEFQRVSAPRVATSRNGRVTGAYSFWVGDLGVKAHVAQVDDYNLDAPRRGNSPDGMERLVNALDAEAALIDGLGELKEEEARRTITDRTAGLAEGIDKNDLKRAFHSTTTHSRSILVNGRQSWLQRDLTDLLNTTGPIAALRLNCQVVAHL